MTDMPVETPVSWLHWIKSFVPALPSAPSLPSMPSRSTQFAFAAVSLLTLWYFGKLPSLPNLYPEPSVAEMPAPVSYVTASEVAPLIVEMAGMKAELAELERRMTDHEKAKAQITTGSISKPKKQ